MSLSRFVTTSIFVSWVATALFFGGFLLSKRQMKARGASDSNETVIPGQGIRDHFIFSLNSSVSSFAADTWRTCKIRDDGAPTRRRVRRVFFFVVDALRLDFMTLQSTQHADSNSNHSGESGEPSSSSHNRFTRMHDLMRERPRQTALFGFRADPPTTTSQRLKALMTGGLPAFVEMGANFDSAVVGEDSLLEQWQRAGKRAVMLGDDTWLHLFPHSFAQSRPFASFNTRDLDSVDDGVLRSLLPLMRGDDDGLGGERGGGVPGEGAGAGRSEGGAWDVFIAHFLGVDHIGHTHHAHHPAMGRRLARMDEALGQVVAQLQQEADSREKQRGQGENDDDDDGEREGEALLLMFGDHGMTDAGEHGGNSPEETLSGLFVYSTGPLFPLLPPAAPRLTWDAEGARFRPQCAAKALAQPRVVEQVDLVPTLALLTGVPVPYTSLGQVVPELFIDRFTKSSSSNHYHDRGDVTLTSAYRENARQVVRYLLHYFVSHDERSASGLELQAANRTLSLAALQACAPSSSPLSPAERVCALAALAALQRDSQGDETNSGPATDSWGWRWGGVVQREVRQLRRGLWRAEVTHQALEALEEAGAPPQLLALVQQHVHELYSQLLSLCLSFCRVQWSHFNVELMVCGVLLSAACLVFVVRACANEASLRSTGAPLRCSSLSLSSLATGALLVYHWASPLSNSFIAQEARVCFFAVQFISLCRVVEICSAWCHVFGGKETLSSRRSLQMLTVAAVLEIFAMCVTRALLQLWRAGSAARTSNSSAASSSDSTLLLTGVVLPLLLFAASVGTLATMLGRQCAAIPGRLVSKGFVAAAVMTLVPHCVIYQTALLDGWAARDLVPSSVVDVLCGFLLSALHSNKQTLQLCLPAVVLGCSSAGVCFEVAQLSVATSAPSRSLRWQRLQGAFYLFAHLSCLVVLVAVSVQHQAVLLVTGQLWFTVLLVASCALVVEAEHRSEGKDRDEGEGVPPVLLGGEQWRWQHICQAAVQLGAMGRLLFFFSHHQYDFGTLQLAAGLVGTEAFHFWYAACLVALNTAGYDLLSHASLMALAALLRPAAAPLPSSSSLPGTETSNGGSKMDKEKQHEDRHELRAGAEDGRVCARLVVGVSCAQRLGVLLGSMASALLQRRHLMLWAVFAPKVIFEAFLWIVDSVCLLLLLWVLR